MKQKITKIINISQKAFGAYKYQLIVLVLLGFASSIFEAIGVNAVIPLFSFVVDDPAGGNAITDFIESLFGFFNIPFSLKYLLIFICLLFLLKAIVILATQYIKIRIMMDYEEDNRLKLFDKTLNAKWPFLIKQKLGHLEIVLINDVYNSAVFLQLFAMLIVVLANLSVYTVVALSINFTITILTLVFGLFVFLLLKRVIYITRQTSRLESVMYKTISNFVNENITGLKTIKSMLVGGKVYDVGAKYFAQFKKYRIKVAILNSLVSSLMQPLGLIFVCVIFAISYKMPDFSLASFVVIIYLIQRIMQYFQQLQSRLQKLNGSFPYLQNLLQYQEEVEQQLEQNPGKEKFTFNKNLVLENIDFYYGNNKILDNISFEIKKGEMVGLIGGSGEGKTTIVDILLRLFEVKEGGVRVDGVDIKDIDLRDWRRNIGYVSQDIFLINDTIEENIKFYGNITKKEIKLAAEKANALDFIEKDKKGFQKVIGERGNLLSGGQRQRVAIARILARKPQILILDEATSALDNESEKKIQDVIEKLKGKVTVLVIAHRLSTVMGCDRIISIAGGKIVEEGRPEKLLKNKDSYFYKVSNIRK